MGVYYTKALQPGDYLQRAIVTYETDGANPNVNVSAVLCDGSGTPLVDTQHRSGASHDGDPYSGDLAFAGYTGWVSSPEAMLTLIPDSPHYVNGPFDAQVQMRWTNGPGGGAFSVHVTDVTFVVERNNVPAFTRRVGKWTDDTVFINDLDDGTVLFDYAEPAFKTIIGGAVSDTEYVNGPRIAVATVDPGAGLVWVHRTANSYEGQFLNDTNERLAGITMASRTRPHVNVGVPSDHPPGDPYDIELPDLLDANYSLLQVWTSDEDGRRCLDPNEFRVTSWNTIRLLSAYPDEGYRVVAWGYFFDD